MKLPLTAFEIKPCSPENLEEIINLQNQALDLIPSVGILRENTPEMLNRCLIPPHVTIGAFYQGALAGFATLYFPGDSDENLAQHLIDVDTEGYKTANYKLCIVRSDYRGNGLQVHLGKILEDFARQSGVDVLCSTVSPINPYSINNIIKLGFEYNRTFNVTKYGGFERNLYYKIIK